MKNLEGKVAMISGTGGGQGRAAALAFAAQGARVFGGGLDPAGCEETVRLVRAQGGEMQSLHPLDLSEMEAARQWARAAHEAFGRIDVLFNNAASLRGRSPFAETTLEEWEQCLRFELTIVFSSSHAVWPYLVAGGGGVILNTASMSGHVETMPIRAPVHGVAKAGVMAFTRMLAAEGAEHGIRAVSISPGLVRSPVTEPLWTGTERQRAVGAAIVAKTPLQRPAECSEIASVAVFLASDGASFITGTDILVDGGFTNVSYSQLKNQGD